MQTIKTANPEGSPNNGGPINWYKKFMAIVAVINLLLVGFDSSYIPLRDIYFHQIPPVVVTYDKIKGIEPHPETENYLETVNQLTRQLQQPNSSLETPQVEDLLESLRYESEGMLNENPFMAAGKFGTFAKIQRRMRQHLGTEYASDAFQTFWTSSYLITHNSNQELNFFQSKITPLIASNYSRSVDEIGQFTDDFWRIDIFFMCFFGLEFLLRTFFMHRRITGLRWIDAMLRRWYDVLLFLPFWRGLRVIPVAVRLQQSHLVNFDRILVQMTHEPAAKLADRLSRFVMVRFINQAQDSIREGTAAQSLLNPQPAIDLNNVNEIEVITDRLLELTIYKVLPQIKPELEAVLHHSIESAFKESGIYQSLKALPGLGNLPRDFTEQMASNLAQTTVTVLETSYADVEGRVLFERLSKEFNQAFRKALGDHQTQEEIQILLTDFLEELKLNYVVKSTHSDPEATLAEIENLYQLEEPPSLPSVQ
ncbi:hypothetical protein J0895_00275 [Phormidium pseudopriestleyi FRX01]|uniref:Uncharacterized protein n=1 Tax=Phormidium pseudopriestleyi FRX01 TaxID=1759528 RepID=A0ABS3FKC4_9CYAN|nr:hypothetical protein [Phormidium pseudopriestleyi]MBO0347568.1 hypothetical protein [Phormidium pseudopriestleyi FRX01]